MERIMMSVAEEVHEIKERNDAEKNRMSLVHSIDERNDRIKAGNVVLE